MHKLSLNSSHPSGGRRRPLLLLLLLLLIPLLLLATTGEALAASEEYEPLTILGADRKPAGSGYLYRGTPYIPLTLYRSTGQPAAGLSFDLNHKDGPRILLDLSRLNLFVGDGTTSQFIRSYGGTVYLHLRRIDDQIYVPLDTAASFAGLAYSLEGDRLYLAGRSSDRPMGRIAASDAKAVGSLVEGRGEAQRYEKGDLVLILGETASYYRISSLSGSLGYIMKEEVTLAGEDEPLLDYYYEAKKKETFGSRKINLVWHYVGNVCPKAPQEQEGIDILAPTWFDQIVEGDGNVENNASLGYTKTARANGYRVWATITNNMSTKGSTNYTTKVLADTALRNKTIAQYLFYACLYDVEGINIDYEDVKTTDRNNLTAFVKEMRKYTERLGLTLSIDTLIPKPWNIMYDYEALGKTVDYLCVMSYDEHYAGSPKAGSVSSLPWVDEAIRDLLTQVDKRKVLLGIPLYARLWREDASGKPQGSSALSMDTARGVMADRGLTPRWLPDIGQYYAEYNQDGLRYRIWLEDPRSLAGRLELVYSYGLAGSACWQYIQGNDAAWEVFSSIYKGGKSPGSFQQPYGSS